MKYLAIILLMMISDAGIAQMKSPAGQNSSEPVYMIDSLKADRSYFNYINPKDVADLKVLKNSQYPDGVIYVTSKDHNKMMKLLQAPLLSLGDIAKTNIPASERSKPVLYILDDNLLTDTAAIRIPSVSVYGVTIVKADETAYFKTALPNILIVKISTKPPVTYIRGIAAQ